MKPAGPVARRGDYVFGEEPHALVASLVAEEHYARGAGKTSVLSFGARRVSDGALVAGCLWLPPLPAAARKAASEEGVAWREVLALSRMVVAPGEPQNVCSMLLSRAVRHLRQHDRRWLAGVTYADEAVGHDGRVYLASGWVDRGWSAPTARWVDPDGRLVSQRATKNISAVDLRARGCTRTTSRKRRFTRSLA